MKRMYRLAALLSALLMLSATAVAELPLAPSGVLGLLESGRSIKGQVGLELNSDMLSALISQGAPPDEGTKTVVDTLLSAVGKLKATSLIAKGAYSLSVGTDAGELFDLRMAMDPETMQNRMTTSLLPGYVLSVDPAIFGDAFSAQGLFPKFPEADMEALLQPYIEALSPLIEERITADLQAEEGPFEVPGVGTFASKAGFDIRQSLVVDVLATVHDLFKTDDKAQAYLTEILQYVAQIQSKMGEEQADPVPDIPKILAEMERAIEEGKAKGDEVLVHVDMFMNDGPEDATLVEATPTTDDEEFFVSLWTQPAENGTVLKISFISEDKGEDEGGEIDWHTVRQQVLSGENYTATLINLNIDASEDAAGGSHNTRLALEVYASGAYNAGLTADIVSAIGDAFGFSGTLALSVFSPDPLLTVSFDISESDENPAAPEEEGETLVLTEETAETSLPGLLEALMGPGLSGLLERLETAMPEEAAIIQMMIGSMMPTAETSEDTWETLDQEGEPVEEGAIL